MISTTYSPIKLDDVRKHPGLWRLDDVRQVPLPNMPIVMAGVEAVQHRALHRRQLRQQTRRHLQVVDPAGNGEEVVIHGHGECSRPRKPMVRHHPLDTCEVVSLSTTKRQRQTVVMRRASHGPRLRLRPWPCHPRSGSERFEFRSCRSPATECLLPTTVSIPFCFGDKRRNSALLEEIDGSKQLILGPAVAGCPHRIPQIDDGRSVADRLVGLQAVLQREYTRVEGQ
jgi:hypothetical protein